MFSQQHSELWRAVSTHAASFSAGDTSSEDVMRVAAEAEPHDLSMLSVLRSSEFGSGGALDAAVLARSRRLREERFGNQVFAVVPIYVTSICGENCSYCNYRSGNKGIGVERLRLSEDELRQEAVFLIEQKGLRALELVYATDPRVRADAICRHVELVRRELERRGGGIVGLSAEALDEEEYRRLVNAGLSFSVLWQETYDPGRYRELHPGSTKKTSLEYRMDAYERMLAAGVPFVGLGVLSGLADWRADWSMLMVHEDYLRRRYERGVSILGTPRLKPAPGALQQTTAFTPSTTELIALVALHGIFSPETMPFVSTREEWDVCAQLAQGGGCLFTFNCSTIPGGYSLGHGGAQFQSRSYDAPVYRERLPEHGVSAVFEWRFEEVLPGCRPMADGRWQTPAEADAAS